MEIKLGKPRPAFGPPEVLEPNEALKKLQGVVYGHAPRDEWAVSDLVGGFLTATPGGIAKLNQIFGYILGVWHGGNLELANRLAADILEQLAYLSNYGGVDTVTLQNVSYDGVPTWRVRLCSDFAFLGLSIAYYRRQPTHEGNWVPEGTDSTLAIKRWGRGWAAMTPAYFHYKYSGNGGLMYDGPNKGENFSVSIGNGRLWRVHT